MAQNLPLGTYLSDGLRSGPNFDSAPGGITGTPTTPGAIVPNPTPYLVYGDGILHSPIYTYFITPALPVTNEISIVNGPISTGQGADVVFSSLANAPAVRKFVDPLTQKPAMQFDVPRCIAFTLNGLTVTDDYDVVFNIFGYDYYGFPMMEKFDVNVTATATSQTFTSKKAFYGLTRLHNQISNAQTDFTSINIQTSMVFGLPYRLYGADLLSVGGGQQADADSAIFGAPADSTVKPRLMTSAELNAAYVQGFFYNDIPLTTADGRTGGPEHVAQGTDVRGIIDVQALVPSLAGPTTGTPPTIGTPMSFAITYYVRGADTGIPQRKSFIDQSQTTVRPVPNRVPLLPNNWINVPAGYYAPGANAKPTVPNIPLSTIDLYGMPQFYSADLIP